MFEVFVLDGCFECVCHCCSMVWNNRDLPARQEAVGFCLSLCDPNRSPDITVSLPGRKPNAGPISNLVFQKIWQLVSDDKLTTILLPPGNLWQYNSTHTTGFPSKKQSGACWTCWELETQLKTENDWMHCCLPPDSGLQRENIYVRDHFLWHTAPGWTTIWLMMSETVH